MDPKTKKYLLIAIAVLAIVKFVGQPVWEWQVEMQQQAATKKRQAVRMNQVLSQQESLSSELQEAQSSLEQLTTVFPKPPSIDALKLRIQQQIGELAKTNKVDVDLVNWGAELPSDVEGIAKQQLNLELSGATKALSLFHTELLSRFANIEQSSAELSFRGSLLKSKVGTLTLSLEVFHWNPAAEAQ